MPEAAKQTIRRAFEDAATYDPVEKSAISVRDGVLEYLGSELGLEPADKVFTVYRSPATMANAAYKMAGIPLTDEHVSIDVDAPQTGSTVVESTVIDMQYPGTDTRLGVLNRLAMDDNAITMMDSKRELSLGYTAYLVPHERYDFEQLDIVPHHLAAVPAGRCGSLCSFLDRKPLTPQSQEADMAGKTKLHKAFLDADGAVSLEQIVEMATGLPEAIKSVPVDKLQELMPALQEIMSYAKSQGVEPEQTADMDIDEEVKDKPTEDMDYEDGDKPKFSDADFRKAVDKEKRTFADAEVKRYAEVVNKARNFLDAEYDFAGKSANEVMRDALATQSTDQFEDSELSVAFKLLRKPDTDYSQFGDSKPEGGLSARIKAEMGE